MSGADANSDVLPAKRELRDRMRRNLRAVSASDRAAWSRDACGHLAASEWFRSARLVMVYLSMERAHEEGQVAEVDCSHLIKLRHGLLKRGMGGAGGSWGVVAPRVDWDGGTMTPALVEPGAGFVVRQFGIPEPGDDAPAVDAREIDLIVVPGLAFDEAGGRLGRGAGYYDRFLEGLEDVERPGGDRPRAVGLGFEAQIVASVPREPHDRLLDAVVTEAGSRLVR